MISKCKYCGETEGPKSQWIFSQHGNVCMDCQKRQPQYKGWKGTFICLAETCNKPFRSKHCDGCQYLRRILID